MHTQKSKLASAWQPEEAAPEMLLTNAFREWRKEMGARGFSGGKVVKNPPANARDTGSSPGPGRSHMLQSN